MENLKNCVILEGGKNRLSRLEIEALETQYSYAVAMGAGEDSELYGLFNNKREALKWARRLFERTCADADDFVEVWQRNYWGEGLDECIKRFAK